MLPNNGVHFMFAFLVGLMCFLVCNSVHINRLDVPPLVELSSQESVVLDCEYTVDNSAGLVVKWFLNNRSNMIYQWIPTRKPQEIGQFKGKLDLDFKASQDPLQHHRALKILKPTVDMSGNYSCLVSTFSDEDEKWKTLQIFSPGKNFQLSHEKNDADTVKLVCLAQDVFPQPTISISSQSGPLKEIKTQVAPSSGGLFDIYGSIVLKEADLAEAEEFVCEMRVPQANYTTKKQSTVYTGAMPTAQLTAAVENALEVHDPGNGAEGIKSTNGALSIFVLLTNLLILVISY